jgi:hypothetical protein
MELNFTTYNNSELTGTLASFEVIEHGVVGSLNGGGPLQALLHLSKVRSDPTEEQCCDAAKVRNPPFM